MDYTVTDTLPYDGDEAAAAFMNAGAAAVNSLDPGDAACTVV